MGILIQALRQMKEQSINESRREGHKPPLVPNTLIVNQVMLDAIKGELLHEFRIHIKDCYQVEGMTVEIDNKRTMERITVIHRMPTC